MRSKIVNVVMIVLAFVIGGVFTYLVIEDPFTTSTTTTTNNGTCYTKCTNKVEIQENGISAAVDKIYNAVLFIQNYQNNQVASTGSGFIYKVDDKYAYVLTNYHVVAGAQKLNLMFADDRVVEGTLLGGDAYLDLAVVRIEKVDNISVAEIGNSEQTKIGDTVFTVGSPLGEVYRNSVSRGTLSGKDRLVTVAVDNSTSENFVMKVLQTDSAVNPGNSGGPLVNSNGQVIGIISLKLVQSEIEGMGFAIPVEYAMSHIESLEKGETIERPMLGVTMANVTTDSYALYKEGILLDKSITYGVVVLEVSPNSGASKSELQKGDVITKIDGNIIKSGAYLRYELYKHNVGDTIEVTFIRGTKEMTTKVQLSKSTT